MQSSDYEIVIGLEVHVQLLTESKCFAPEANDFGAEPNTHISVINLAHPGTLPKVNRKTIELATKMGLAVGSQITRTNVFARKNYFYPDLPKGYQLTQDHNPICVGGQIVIRDKANQTKTIQLHHIHLEEDAGKSIHTQESKDTLLDYNRAGVPLIEMVTEPVLRSAEEASLFLQEIRRLVRWIGVSDGNLEEGSLRCDANVSVKLKSEEKLGTRVEIKNLNSFRFVQKAIEYEASRQIEAIQKGEKIVQETRLYDSQLNKTFGMRSKENLHDYRYFPEPDLTPVVIAEAWLAQLQAEMPALPQQLEAEFAQKYGLPAYDCEVLTDTREMANYFLETIVHTNHYKAVANWLMKDVRNYLNENRIEIQDFPLQPERLAELINLIAEKLISQTVASQQLFPLLCQAPQQTAKQLAEQHNLLLDTTAFDLDAIIQEVLGKFADKVKEYQKGKKGLIGMFVGEVMKQTQGKVLPKEVNKKVLEYLSAE